MDEQQTTPLDAAANGAAPSTPDVMPVEVQILMLRDEVRRTNRLIGLACVLSLSVGLVLLSQGKHPPRAA